MQHSNTFSQGALFLGTEKLQSYTCNGMTINCITISRNTFSSILMVSRLPLQPTIPTQSLMDMLQLTGFWKEFCKQSPK